MLHYGSCVVWLCSVVRWWVLRFWHFILHCTLHWKALCLLKYDFNLRSGVPIFFCGGKKNKGTPDRRLVRLLFGWHIYCLSFYPSLLKTSIKTAQDIFAFRKHSWKFKSWLRLLIGEWEMTANEIFNRNYKLKLLCWDQNENSCKFNLCWQYHLIIKNFGRRVNRSLHTCHFFVKRETEQLLLGAHGKTARTDKFWIFCEVWASCIF